jgi:hypothetical protein
MSRSGVSLSRSIPSLEAHWQPEGPPAGAWDCQCRFRLTVAARAAGRASWQCRRALAPGPPASGPLAGFACKPEGLGRAGPAGHGACQGPGCYRWQARAEQDAGSPPGRGLEMERTGGPGVTHELAYSSFAYSSY